MPAENVIAIFDIGKTNKKLFLLNTDYKIIFEISARLTETLDEDGDSCEDIKSLRSWVFNSLKEASLLKQYKIVAINFSTYGASLVYLDETGNPVAPLYNYLKEYPAELKQKFYSTYGGEEEFSYRTASPVLGSLNSGMQLYRIKYDKPELFARIKYALHLPQYLNHLFTGKILSDITSVGCHTNLWDFQNNEYHYWVKEEDVLERLAPLYPCDEVTKTSLHGNNYIVGSGLHDSSAALIPYLLNFQQPFVLISTGTWCISLNPFNNTPLTKNELANDCLCYITYEGMPVKASRLFAGHEHEQQADRISHYFNQSVIKYQLMKFDPQIIFKLQTKDKLYTNNETGGRILKRSLFEQRDMHSFASDEEAYHQLILDIVTLQYTSTQLVLRGTKVTRIFVDGGFSKNVIYMNLLASFFPAYEVYAASVAQATAVGAALCIHKYWNKNALPNDIIELKYYSCNPIKNED
ncbi:MAG: FGGY family carbohydrate kinase [Ginsengibacter sp.]